jgi:hypothetical protein
MRHPAPARSGIAALVAALLVPLLVGVAPAAAQEPPGPNSVTAHGVADHHGPEGGMRLADDLVGIAAHPAGGGYWAVARDGGIFSFGNAPFRGSTGDISLNEPIVGMAAHPSGEGYWLVASDGGVFSFGAVGFHGSMGDRALNQPVVGMASTPSGEGYWLVAADGGIFSFGDAVFRGSTGDISLNQPIVGMTAHPSGDGYWFVARDGGLFSFGNARFHGSLGDQRVGTPVRGMAATPEGDGYWMVGQNGRVWDFGGAVHHGNAVAADQQRALTVGMAPHPGGAGYWLVHGPAPLPDREEVSSFTTPLQPGQDRNQNIHLALDIIDGSVIRPGERFSLDDAIGPRTRERGFKENGFIDDGELGSTVGGGVSQVATTFVNAAWFSGIRIDEFRQHSIYFERYPMCREATLARNLLDVVIVNDSPFDLTVRTGHTSSSATVTFVSRPWASVDSWIGQPRDIEGPDGAFTVDCGRTISYPDGTTSQESYTWRYDSGFPG